MRKGTLLSIGLIISFFLPWISTFLGSINGFGLAGNGALFALPSVITYVLYLIPLFAAINIIFDFIKPDNENYTIGIMNEFITGTVICIAILIFVLIKKIFPLLGIGYYLTFIISIAGSIFFDDDRGNKINIPKT